MKKSFLLLVLCFFYLPNLNSQVLFTENFAYPAGDSIGSHDWTWNTGTTNTIFVVSPGLTYSGYPLSGIGNACHLRNNGNDAYKPFTTDSIGVLYLSFMVNIDSIRTPGDYFIAMISPTSTTNYTARFYAKDSSGLAFGLSKTTAANGGIFYTGGSYSLRTTYLVVIKYQFNPGTTDDVMSAYIFSSGIPATEPGTPTIGPVTGTANDGPLGRIALRQGTAASSPTLNIDGIQVAKTWAKISVSVNSLSSVAENFDLFQNYPNPFNPETTIEFSIPQSGFVNLTVFNPAGQIIKSLINKNLNAGSYRTVFDGRDINSGVYLYRISYINNKGQNYSNTKKLILIK